MIYILIILITVIAMLVQVVINQKDKIWHYKFRELIK